MVEKKSTKSQKKPEPKKTSVVEGIVYGERMNARRGIIEEMFNDMYQDRRNIYIMNLIRGIFFGVGSAIGGTIVLALLVWILSFFVNIPGVGDFIKQTTSSIQTEQKR